MTLTFSLTVHVKSTIYRKDLEGKILANELHVQLQLIIKKKQVDITVSKNQAL